MSGVGVVELTNKAVSYLFGLAAGRCSVCKTPVVHRDVKIGEMAHIIARKKGGARGDLPFQGDINGYNNLILLCPNHHTEVDNNPAAYPPETLHRIKDEHEHYVRQVFDRTNQGRAMDIGGLMALMKYLPFTQIPALMQGLPTEFNLRLLYVDDTCERFGSDFPQCRPFHDQYLEQHFFNFWKQIRELCNYVNYSCFGEDGIRYYDTLARSNKIYVSRNLSSDERQNFEEKIRVHVDGACLSYNAFLQFLKSNYPEINLASFVG